MRVNRAQFVTVDGTEADMALWFPPHYLVAHRLARFIARWVRPEWRRIRVYRAVVRVLRAEPQVVPAKQQHVAEE